MKRIAALVGALLGLMAGGAQAVPGNYDIIQSQTFSESSGLFGSAGVGANGNWSPLVGRVATVNPFSSYDTGSGTLRSVTIRWNNEVSFSGKTGQYGGNAGGGSAGGVSVNDKTYGGSGGRYGSASSGAAGVTISFTETWHGSDPADFFFSIPAVNYSQDIAQVFAGTVPFTVSQPDFLTSASFYYSGITEGQFDTFSEVFVTYNYDGEQVPVPATAALLSLGLVGIGAARRKKA